MYRVFFILGGGLLLAACSSSPSWMNLDSLKPEPITDSVAFESDPPGADATLSIGQTCKTPCTLRVPTSAPFSVTFTLPGYQPDTEQVELVAVDGSNKLNPNPVVAELTAAPPSKKPPARKTTVKKKTVTTTTTTTVKRAAPKKPAAAPKPAASSSAAPAPAASSASPPPPAATAPWPAPPKQ